MKSGSEKTIRELLDSVDIDSLPVEGCQLRDRLLTALAIHVPPSPTPYQAEQALKQTLARIQCADDVMVPGESGPAVSSATLIGDGKDNQRALLLLSTRPPDSGTLNNMGCANMWLRAWSSAVLVLTEAYAAETLEAPPGSKQLAKANYDLCQLAIVHHAALKASGG